MKLLTLNTHSLVEENYQDKLKAFVSAVIKEKPHIIALQEVNQTISMPAVMQEMSGYTACRSDIVIRSDNHILSAAEMLRKNGVDYYWTWLPLKKGYGIYEEGIGIMSRSAILETFIVPVSRADDYNDWKTRKLIGIRTEAMPDEWFFSVHYGWWNDEAEPFSEQWIKTNKKLKKYENVWLMGDFNNPAEIRGEGYDMMSRSYWHDSYISAEVKEGDITAEGSIDGWKDKNTSGGMRIDQIWSRKREVITSTKVIFDGKTYPVVSDHYGVMVNYERSIV